MLTNPRIGQFVKVWYRESNRGLPYHNKIGYIIISGKGKPRNHLIKIFGGPCAVVPCGNLNSTKQKG